MKTDTTSGLRPGYAARAVLAGALLLAGCSSRGEPDDDPDPGVMCTMEARSAFVVSVLDASTEENLGPDATVRVTDGTHSERLELAAGSVFVGAYERAGTYTVIVSHPGYQQWQRMGVVVERDECHVIPEAVEARLIPGTDTGG